MRSHVIGSPTCRLIEAFAATVDVATRYDSERATTTDGTAHRRSITNDSSPKAANAYCTAFVDARENLSENVSGGVHAGRAGVGVVGVAGVAGGGAGSGAT